MTQPADPSVPQTGVPTRRYVRSVGTHLALATAVLVLMMASALYYALIRYERAERLRIRRDVALVVARLFAELSSAPVDFGDDQGIRDSLGYLRTNDEVTQAAVFSLLPDGSCGPALGTWTRTPAQSSMVRAPPARDVGLVVQTQAALDVSQWVTDPSGQRIAVVSIRFSLARENRSFALLKTRALQISWGVACLLTLLLLLLARIYIIAPLRSVHSAVRDLTTGTSASSIARGRRRLPLRARDEIGDLARGFVSMADAIEGREAAIAAQNHDMRLVLTNVGEGFLVLDARGIIEGQHSAVLETWFGAVQSGQALWEYLHPYDPETAEWLGLTWSNIGTPGMPLALCLEQLPKTCTANERHYQVEYHALRGEHDRLDKMVVVIDDVTELRRREQAESEQRELVAVFTTLIRDRTGFISVCEDAKALITNVSGSSTPATYDVIEHLHTIKGNADLYRLREFAKACELVEADCVRDKRLPSSDDAVLLAHAFSRSVDPVAPFIALDRGQSVQISSRDYAAIVRALETGESSAEVLSRFTRASAEPAEIVFGRFSERLQVLARRLGKCPVRMVIEPGGMCFPKQPFEALWAAIVHVLRNIADHALESAWEREQAGKSVEATVTIRAHTDHPRVIIAFIDDGRGVDWELVRVRAEQRGWPNDTRADLVSALLRHGFSTSSSSTVLSGRGVGLSALRTEVETLGGTLSFESETGRWTALTIELPASLVLGTVRASGAVRAIANR